MITHLEKLWCAMFVSEGWYEMWRHHKDSPYKSHALKCKTVGIVEFDRILNNYETAMKIGDVVPDMFVYGDYE